MNRWEGGFQWVFYMNLSRIPEGRASAAGERELGKESRRSILGLHPRISHHFA
jgi:hypothetical protein